MRNSADMEIKRNPLVTVITVFLNAERFIEEAIASVFAQSYRHWELLLVNDGSTDRSTAIALEYARLHPDRVRYLEHSGHENRGISASHNLALRASNGEYIAFLDSDDVWFPDKLERQVAILNSQPEAALVYGVTQYWYSWNVDDKGRRDLIFGPGVEPDSLVRPPALLAGFLQEELPIPCPSDVMVRRNAAVEAEGFEDSFRRIFTDQVFYSKLLLKWPAFACGQNLFRYRKHSVSAVSVVRNAGGLRNARLTYLAWLKHYLDDRAISEPAIRRALRMARLKCRFPYLFRFRSHARYRALVLRELLRTIIRRILPVTLYRLLRRVAG